MYKNGQTVEEAKLWRSAKLLDHRGPDSSGVHAHGPVGLAHTRFSLIDLNERSRQPFWDPSGQYCLIYNGEIYNFKELREDLELRGVAFRTTGRGIPTEMLDKVFEPFDRLGAEQSHIPGTGIGLTVTKKLIESMGGTVGVESTVDQGTRFWINLPTPRTEENSPA